jgi:hypothetical protein
VFLFSSLCALYTLLSITDLFALDSFPFPGSHLMVSQSLQPPQIVSLHSEILPLISCKRCLLRWPCTPLDDCHSTAGVYPSLVTQSPVNILAVVVRSGVHSCRLAYRLLTSQVCDTTEYCSFRKRFQDFGCSSVQV